MRQKRKREPILKNFGISRRFNNHSTRTIANRVARDGVVPPHERAAALLKMSLNYVERCRKRTRLLVGPVTDSAAIEKLEKQLNCPPPFAVYRPQSFYCRSPSCPSCRARQAREFWRSIDQQLFPRDDPKTIPNVHVLKGGTLFRRQTVYALLIPPMKSQAELGKWATRMMRGSLISRLSESRPGRGKKAPLKSRGSMVRREYELKRYRNYKVIAGADMCRFSVRGDPRKPTHLLFVVRQLLWLKTADVQRFLKKPTLQTAPGLSQSDGTVIIPAGRIALKRYDDPTRRTMARACGWLFSFEQILAKGSLVIARAALRTRKHRRLFARFGDYCALSVMRQEAP
jgi:hypothetical protein